MQAAAWTTSFEVGDNLQAFYGNSISTRLSSTPEGFLVAQGARVARSGWQMYRPSELKLPGCDLVEVFRPPSEVCADTFIASLNGKCICDGHPGQDWVSAENARFYCAGHLQNPREGTPLANGDRVVVGDLVVTEENLIRKIENGTRELSVGYQYELVPRGDGTYEQRDLVANHIAVVPTGRGGQQIRILDHALRAPARTACCPQELARIAGRDEDIAIAEINFAAAARRFLGQNVLNVAQQRKNR